MLQFIADISINFKVSVMV